ncbi:response regulator transcription factor [Sphingobacterium sp. N143]|uniref:response regulator n=1 Tax=Sphingobacterium sp. N143 TaxID=2746727 RepID=UPI0025754D55|nr:response regulator transcription factor [Sphingobacterium sp. N143]MDM1296688.1 response regulator transcription factor [Sphingobacterium sp. N143]
MSKKSITLALVDDHPIVLEGLRSLFVKYEVPYYLLCFENGKSILSFLDKNTVDIVLLDIVLPDVNGIDICKTIKTQYPATIVIALSNQAEQSTILQILQQGASGFILKDSPAEEILTGIYSALQGEVVLSSNVRQIMTTPTTSAHPLPSLTKREKQLLQLLAQGKTTKVIADELFLSKLTVDTYRKNLLQKFAVKNIAELLVLLVEHKMI